MKEISNQHIYFKSIQQNKNIFQLTNFIAISLFSFMIICQKTNNLDHHEP